MPAINWLAVVASTVAGFILGGLWYGPLFSKIWVREMGGAVKPRIARPLLFAITIAMTFIAASAFGAFLGPHPGLALAIGAGASTGIVWVGFSMATTYMFAGRSFALAAVDCGFPAAQFILFGVIFALIG